MSWYPEKSTINISELDEVATFTMEGGNLESFEPHIFQLSDWMDAQGSPANASIKTCREHINTTTKPVLKRDLQTAVRYRKSSQYSLQQIGRDAVRDAPWDAQAGRPSGTPWDVPKTHTNTGGTPDGTPRDASSQAQRDGPSLCNRDGTPSPPTEPTYQEF